MLILMFCIAALLAALKYTSQALVNFSEVSTQVYCEKRDDFNNCAEEFKKKTSELMKKR